MANRWNVENPKTGYVTFRATPVVVQKIKELAAKEQVGLSTWINEQMLRIIETYENRV